MIITLNDLGPLKKASFELADLTVICGQNNTGKTYATYALFGFLQTWQRYVTVNVSRQKIDEIVNDGVTDINISDYANKSNVILSKGCQRYTQQLPKILASNSKHFSNTQFSIDLEQDIESIIVQNFERKLRSKKSELLSFSKPKGESILTISLLSDIEKFQLPNRIIKDTIANAISEILFDHYFPNPFIISSERTGAAIFSKELNFSRNRLLEDLAHPDKEIDPFDLLLKSYDDYALPVKVNVDFTRRIEDIITQDSFIATEHPHVLNEFSDIIGGEYISGDNNSIYFKPSKKRIGLTMGESSSIVRSMLNLGSYLRHIAKPGDLLMVDEPELNLHPENQRRVARLFARLTNLGIRVFITTHSDYIIKEFNLMIMLNQDKPYLRQIAENEGYQREELLNVDRVNVYMADRSLMKANENSKRKSKQQTLKKAEVTRQQGINAYIFDETINRMNEIHDAIIWGDDDEY